jgi:hypothetical protein
MLYLFVKLGNFRCRCTFPLQEICLAYAHRVEVSTTRGTTALVYCLKNSSLYTGTVHRWWSTSNMLDGHQGCSQLSTIVKLFYFHLKVLSPKIKMGYK